MLMNYLPQNFTSVYCLKLISMVRVQFCASRQTTLGILIRSIGTTCNVTAYLITQQLIDKLVIIFYRFSITHTMFVAYSMGGLK